MWAQYDCSPTEPYMEEFSFVLSSLNNPVPPEYTQQQEMYEVCFYACIWEMENCADLK